MKLSNIYNPTIIKTLRKSYLLVGVWLTVVLWLGLASKIYYSAYINRDAHLDISSTAILIIASLAISVWFSITIYASILLISLAVSSFKAYKVYKQAALICMGILCLTCMIISVIANPVVNILLTTTCGQVYQDRMINDMISRNIIGKEKKDILSEFGMPSNTISYMSTEELIYNPYPWFMMGSGSGISVIIRQGIIKRISYED